MLNSLKPVKNTTNLMEASMLNPTPITKNKTNLMEASMLNTLKTNLILTRGALIALFAGLFILAACGGGGGAAAPTTSGGPGVNPCDTNPFGTTDAPCTRDEDAVARTMVYDACRDVTTSRATATACTNVPMAVRNCLDDPFLSSCNQAVLTANGAASGAFLSLQADRVEVCREGNEGTDNGQCTRALATRCFDESNPANIFDPLCSKSSVEGRRIIAKCVDSATLATDADCADARNANDVGVSCFQNPWDTDCELLPDFASLYLTAARTNRVAYCADTEATGFNSSLCTDARTAVCAASGASANPFSELCTGASNTYESVRTAFATNCFNDANNGAKCNVTFEVPGTGDTTLCGDGTPGSGTNPNDATCMATSVSVATCADAPFSTACRGVPTFADARTALLGICTNGVVDDKDSFCDADGSDNGGFTADEITCLANPFTPDAVGGINCGTLFTALGDSTSLKTAQDALIAVCTSADGADNSNCNAGDMDGAVATCLDNPFDMACDTTLGTKIQADAARDNFIELCTGDGADGTNMRCTIEGQTPEILILTACLRDPFGNGCDTALGATQAMKAQSNVLALCTAADSDNFATNSICTRIASPGSAGDANGNLKTCLNNPFTAGTMLLGATTTCETVLGGTEALMRAQANLNTLCLGDSLTSNPLCTDALKMSQFCTATADPFNVNCDAVDGIDAGARATFCTTNAGDSRCTTHTTCNANPFASDCLAEGNLYGDNRASALVDCTAAAGDADCALIVSGTTTVTQCQANPFLADCADGVFDDTRTASIGACVMVEAGMRDSNAACTGVEIKAAVPPGPGAAEAVTLDDCVANPYLTACADGAFDGRRTISFNACNNESNKALAVCTDLVVKEEGADNPGDPAVTIATCIATPFNAACTGVSHLDTARDTVRFLCTDGSGQMKTDACGTVVGQDASDMPVTVQGCLDDPFSADCTNGAFDNARLDSYATCDGVSDTDKATNADCMRVVVAAVTGENAADAVTVADCVANPFATGCVIDGFKSVRDGICITVVPNGQGFRCIAEEYSATVRVGAITFCRNNPTHESCGIAVSGDTGAPTVGACVTNPFTAGCDVGELAELFDIADQKVAYCATDAPTIFDTNCDTARPEVVAERAAAVRTCLADGVAIAAYAAGTGTGTDINPVCMRTVLGMTAVIEAIALDDVIGDGPDGLPGTADDIKATADDVRARVEAMPINLASCVENPYLSECVGIESFAQARYAHRNVCMRDGNAGNPACADLLATLATTNSALATCITNPFASTCSGDIYSSAKTNRYAFCRNGADFENTLCDGDGETTGTTIISEICAWDGVADLTDEAGMRINPIAGICDPTTNVDAKRYYCGIDGRRASESACDAMNVNTADGCLANPFSAECRADIPSVGATITEELRTFLTTQRRTYCTENVADKDFQVSLCQTSGGALDSDTDFASIVCESLGEDANPFAPFCVRDGNDFDADRVTFVEACGALDDGVNRLGAGSDGVGATGATCAPEVIACYADPFVAGTGATDCIGEAAYAMARQSVVNNCAGAFNGGTHATDDDCATIMTAGQLTCITTNPYENRADVIVNDIVTEAGLNCLGNANYAVVRTALEMDCAADGTGTDARCGTVLAGVCGTGTAGSELAIGTDPFNAKFCLDAANLANYVDQREKLVADCVLDGTAAGCTTQINNCIADPFLVDGIATGVNCDDDRFKVAFQARSIAYCGFESKDVGGTPTANISRSDCRAFATVLGGSNPCVRNPFDSGCTNNSLGGAADALTRAQTLRATYCATLGTSDEIRVLADESVCRGAVSDVCKGDALFDGTGTYNCLADKTTYNAARATYATMTCSGNTVARDGAECTNAIVEICTTTDGLQTNPWAAACNETSPADSIAERRTVVAYCAGLGSDNDRTTTPRCNAGDAATIYSTCNPTSGDPRNAACDDYAGTGQHFANARSARYVLDCADADAVTGGSDAALCPDTNVKPVICVDAGTNARPFAPICRQGVAIGDLATRQNTLLAFCLESGNGAMAQCAAGTAPLTAGLLDVCGSDATDNPFNNIQTNSDLGSATCASFTAFNGARTAFRTACRTAAVGAVDYNTANCNNKGTVLEDICGSTLDANSNPFSGICDAVTHLTTRQIFANACENPAGNSVLLNGATCPPAVINCATNPFNPGCTDDAAYNSQKRAVLSQCQDSALVAASSSNARCKTARAQTSVVGCLADALGCTDAEANAQFAQAAEGATTYRNTIQQNRVAYCAEGNRVNTEKEICRTTAEGNTDTGNKLFGFCLQNPFSGSCADELGAGNQAGIRSRRIEYCEGLPVNEVALGIQTNAPGETTVGKGDASHGGVINLCYVADGSLFADAIGNICYGVDGNDNSKDPFTLRCREFDIFNARRATRLTDCAGASSGSYECGGYNAARLLCNVATNARPADCPAVQTYATWISSATTPVFNAAVGTTNQFLAGLTASAPDFSNNANLEQVEAGRLLTLDAALPSIRFFSARTPQVDAVEAREAADAVTAINEGDALPGPDGILGNADDTVAGAGDVRAAKDAVTQQDEVIFQPAGANRFYVGLTNAVTSFDVGAPLFDRAETNATWTGTIDWIGQGTAANATARTGFNLRVNYSARTIQGAIPIAAGTNGGSASEGLTGNHLVINGSYTGAGIISGDTSIRDYTATPNPAAGAAISIGASINGSATAEAGTLRGIIGHKAAVGVFINNGTNNTNGYGGGFIVRPQ